MKTVPIILAVLITLFLAGCAKTVEKAILDANGIQLNSDGSGTMKIGDDKGMIAVGDNVKVPDSFPKDVPMYAGAKVKTAFNMGAATQVSLTTTDTAAQVSGYYKSTLTSAGWTVGADMASSEAVTMSLSKGKQRLQVMIGPASGQTDVVLTASTED